MSKTVDDLKQVYLDAWCAAEGDAISAGIAAVVRALRDEAFGTIDSNGDQWSADGAWDWFNEILGDAGDEVAGKNEGYSHAEPSPATDPAPAVCEWRVRNKRTLYVMPCDKAHRVGLTEEWKDLEDCPHCGLPIKFTEAK